ncbi:MAG: hypothetical protein JO364_12695 [Pseudonocardiales bacterium]|nr:hypothetical protein [Pseudonocardiales bacterium]
MTSGRPTVQLSLQTIGTRRAPSGQAVWRVRRYDWDTTPGILRVARIVLVLGVLLAGGVGVYAALARVNTTRDIAEHLEPLSTTVTTLYRSLADADATVAAGYLSGGVEPTEIQTRYERDLAAATASLAQAGTQAGGEQLTAKRIADITTQLPTYTGLVERARANNRQGFVVGVSYLRRASKLMQDSILPEAAELQQRQAARLDDAYRRAGSVPVVALAACGVSLAGLVWAQVFLLQRTHRVFNVGLVLASVAVIAGLVWWTVAGVASAGSLVGALGHSRSVSDALAPAQIAALQARAFESLELVDRNGGAIEPDFEARMQRLARNNGTGGALGAAQHFATDRQGKALVQAAIDATRGYAAAHRVLRRLDDAGEYPQAVDAAVNSHPASAATTFDRLDAALKSAVEYEHGAFEKDIEHARGWLTGLPAGTGMLALVAAVGVVLGVRQRLEEYR